MGPYTRIEGPEKFTFPGAPDVHVSSPEGYLAWQAAHLVAKGSVATRWSVLTPVQAWIEHGRWILRCLNCRSGLLTRPDWRIACCISCGAVHHDVVFPANHAAIEQALLERPDRNTQSWLLRETLDDLIAENVAHAADLRAFQALQGKV